MTTENKEFDTESLSRFLSFVLEKESEWAKTNEGKDDVQPLFIPTALSVRAPNDNFAIVMDECLAFIKVEFLTQKLPFPEMGIFTDTRHGVIHVALTPPMARSAGQLQDLFWKVELSHL